MHLFSGENFMKENELETRHYFPFQMGEIVNHQTNFVIKRLELITIVNLA